MKESVKIACKNVLSASTSVEKAMTLHTATIVELSADGVDWSDLSKTIQEGFQARGEWPSKLQYHRWAVGNKDNYTGDAPKASQEDVMVGVNKAAEMRNKAGVALNRFNAFKSKFQGIDDNEELIPKAKAAPKQAGTKQAQDEGKVADPADSRTSAGHVVDKDELYTKTLALMYQEFDRNKDADGVALVQTLAEKVGIQLTEEQAA